MAAKSDRPSQPYDAADSLQFYDDVQPLVNEMGRTLCVALDQGYAAVCIVSDQTREALEKQLWDRGVDVVAARNRGQYVHLDAAETLSKITLLNGGPDPARFDEVVGDLIHRLVAKYARVWMYGELAALMWVGGNQTGAMQLDKLWTSFAATTPVCLCVAFPMEALSYPAVVEALEQVVADHIRSLAKDSPLALAIRHGPSHSRDE